MALLPQPILDYSDKDFASLRLRLQGLARSVFPEWTDFNQANFGNLLLELFSYVGDTLTFYQDAQARETFWPTVTRRISAVRLGRLINFNLSSASPATGVARFSVATPISGSNAVIQPGTRIRSLDPLDPLPFRTSNTEPVIWTVGTTFVDVNVEQTEELVNEIFEATGAANQEIVLSRVPYLEKSAIISASDGNYKRVETFLDATPTDPRCFVEVVDQNDRGRIRFGNGALGKIPEGSIAVTYKITRGEIGNLEAGKLGSLVDPILHTGGAAVSGVLVSNLAAFSGGVNRMSVAQARSLAPASLRALTRSVTRSDFETHALEVPGVARVAMLTRNEDLSVPENAGRITVIARGARLASGNFRGAVPTDQLMQQVLEKVTIEKPATITFQVSVLPVDFKPVDVFTTVHFAKGADVQQTCQDISNALRDYFAVSLSDGTPNPNVDFGANILNATGTIVAELAWSDIFNVIRDVQGIRKLDEGSQNLLLNTVTTRDPIFGVQHSVSYGLREFMKLNRIVVKDAVTNVIVYQSTGDASV